MPLPIPVSEIAVNDWSPVYGTVRSIKDHFKPGPTPVLTSRDITWYNGEVSAGLDPTDELDLVQGGLNDRVPTSSVRPGLAADHDRE